MTETPLSSTSLQQSTNQQVSMIQGPHLVVPGTPKNHLQFFTLL